MKATPRLATLGVEVRVVGARRMVWLVKLARLLRSPRLARFAAGQLRAEYRIDAGTWRALDLGFLTIGGERVRFGR